MLPQLFMSFGGYGSYYLESYWLYIVLVIPALILSLVAQASVKKSYAKMSKVYSKSGYSGAQAADAVLKYYGISNVRIEQCSGKLSDHFDPRTNVIRLSEGVYSSTSIAAIGIACHEAGHAAQHAQGYLPIRMRNAVLPVCRIGSYAGIPLAFLGLALGFEPLVAIGLLLYAFIAVFQLATLPVELNASSRALAVIEDTALLKNEEELKGAKSVLRSAAWTYVAALAVSLANLMRFIILFTSRTRRRR